MRHTALCIAAVLLLLVSADASGKARFRPVSKAAVLATKRSSGGGTHGGALACVKTKEQAACDGLPACTWCKSTSVEAAATGTGCYPLKATRLLPKDTFACDKVLARRKAPLHKQHLRGLQRGPGHKQLLPGVATPQHVRSDGCDQKPEAQCVAPGCVWCTSAAVGGGCYTPAQAKLLPSAIFKCKTAPSAAETQVLEHPAGLA